MAGGVVGMLALNALFILMKDYNLYVLSAFSCSCFPENVVNALE
jgi:hypothetical protein